MRLISEEGSRPIRVWTDDVEDAAMQQLRNTARLPFLHPHGVCAMPDVHYGIGATVGSVVATVGAIVPAAVGVDIGCGMMAVRLSGARAEHLPDSLSQIRSEIEHTVPTGFERHAPAQQNEVDAKALYDRGRWIFERFPEMLRKRKDGADQIVSSQFGTLGGGNHFIELCVDERQELWVMLHSGSRGIGNQIGTFFIARARALHERLDSRLPDADLAWFAEGEEDFRAYVAAVGWAQDYARANREEMMRRILIVMKRHAPPFRTRDEVVNCHHNYVARERHFDEDAWVTRKGAISARLGELGLIPGSMGQRSYVVRGLGSAASYHSCSHGAGRRMGRKEARRRFTVADLAEQTKGVECRKDDAVLDEIPGSYKDIGAVMLNQRDLVEVVHTLKQVLCVKGA